MSCDRLKNNKTFKVESTPNPESKNCPPYRNTIFMPVTVTYWKRDKGEFESDRHTGIRPL